MKNKLSTLFAALGEFAQDIRENYEGFSIHVEYKSSVNEAWVTLSSSEQGSFAFATSSDFDTAVQMVSSLRTEIKSHINDLSWEESYNG